MKAEAMSGLNNIYFGKLWWYDYECWICTEHATTEEAEDFIENFHEYPAYWKTHPCSRERVLESIEQYERDEEEDLQDELAEMNAMSATYRAEMKKKKLNGMS